jgi:hypothetical protein
VDTEGILSVILFLSLGLGFTVLGYWTKRPQTVLFAGLVWLVGAVLIAPELGIAFAIIALGLGLIMLFEGASAIAQA